MRRPLIACLTLLISLSAISQSIAEFTSEMKKYDGFAPYYYDEDGGMVFLEVKSLNQEFLYVNSLAAGIGSNDIGLDRGQLGREHVVKFEKHGPKILLVQLNYDYRAVSDNADEVKSVKEAFAQSVLGGFEILQSDGGRYLIDITDFLLQDSHNVAATLRRGNQTDYSSAAGLQQGIEGNYSLDKSRSVIYSEGLLNFPKNTEFEALLTFVGESKGYNIRSVTPSPDAVTVRTHHSFIELPDNKYTPRVFDPRSGFFNISYQDYATPIEESLVKRFIVRHRLEKKDPNAAISEAVEPIIYYVDRGAPEPVRSALIEGASWWNQAFEAAGFKDAFQVKVMPEGAHPLDVRYNVIQWIHRSTRGWSYGSGITDPRTGEMLKGHVSLGSLRVRQDFLIATGLLQPYENGTEVPKEMTEMALARLRQLSAHEVGHTLGLAHNYISSIKNRSSVMDYPHPYVLMDEFGNIDLSQAYDDKIGDWDKASITYGYAQFPEGENQEKLVDGLDKAFASGLRYITDQDARPASGAHPTAHLWDNGASAADELDRMMKIRRTILDRFSEKVIKEGTPMSSIEEVLVPMYLFHRYQVEAAAKVVGGVEYNYALRGDKQVVRELLGPREQLQALDAILETVEPRALELSDALISKLPPRAFGYSRSRETFQSRTGVVFDQLAAMETAANLSLGFLFNADRANRLVMHKMESLKEPGFEVVLDQIISRVFASSGNGSKKTIHHIVQSEMLDQLMTLANHDRAYDDVKAICVDRLLKLKKTTKGKEFKDDPFYAYVSRRIDLFMDDPSEFKSPKEIKAPDGSPIGSCDF
jgi:hypothetical protein